MRSYKPSEIKAYGMFGHWLAEKVYGQGLNARGVSRDLGLHRDTVRKNMQTITRPTFDTLYAYARYFGEDVMKLYAMVIADDESGIREEIADKMAGL